MANNTSMEPMNIAKFPKLTQCPQIFGKNLT